LAHILVILSQQHRDVVVVFCKRPCHVRLQTAVMTSGVSTKLSS